MSAYQVPAGGPSHGVADRVLDRERAGSVWGQVLVGVVGFVLALTLVLGQVTLATTKGMQRTLAENVEQLRDGNETMKSVIVRAQPATVIDTKLSEQAATLARTNRTMVQVNKEMAVMGATTGQLGATTGRMDTTSGELARHVAGMATVTGRLSGLLGGLPAVTDTTHKRLTKIDSDTAAINGELEAISGKMEGYGLPQAKGVRKR